MARLGRIVIPGAAHHVAQHVNRRLPVFFKDDDGRAYLTCVGVACAAQDTRCLAWCLIGDHIHLILGPLLSRKVRPDETRTEAEG